MDSGASSTVHPPPTAEKPLTREQIMRIEANRLRALELRAKAEASLQAAPAPLSVPLPPLTTSGSSVNSIPPSLQPRVGAAALAVGGAPCLASSSAPHPPPFMPPAPSKMFNPSENAPEMAMPFCRLCGLLMKLARPYVSSQRPSLCCAAFPQCRGTEQLAAALAVVERLQRQWESWPELPHCRAVLVMELAAGEEKLGGGGGPSVAPAAPFDTSSERGGGGAQPPEAVCAIRYERLLLPQGVDPCVVPELSEQLLRLCLGPALGPRCVRWGRDAMGRATAALPLCCTEVREGGRPLSFPF